MKRICRGLAIGLLCLSTLSPLLACRATEAGQSSSEGDTACSLQVTVDASALVWGPVRTYLNTPDGTNITDVLTDTGRYDQGVSAQVECASEAVIVSGSIEITEAGESEGRVFPLVDGTAELYNLKTNAEYEYHATVTTELKGTLEATGSFNTEDTVRLLNVENIVNARDIGNRKVADGRTIKQGLLYRGSELDGLVESAYRLTEEGKRTMLEDLRIRTLFDLRNPEKTARKGGVLSDYAAPLGEGVKRTFYNAAQYEGVFTEDGMEKIRMIFADLANEDNYPVYLHCTYGCDRTGTVGLLLDGLLGCTEETAVRGYELSALYRDFRHITRTNCGSFLSRLKVLYGTSGKSYAQRVEAYLLACGVTQAQMESIRGIFLG